MQEELLVREERPAAARTLVRVGPSVGVLAARARPGIRLVVETAAAVVAPLLLLHLLAPAARAPEETVPPLALAVPVRSPAALVVAAAAAAAVAAAAVAAAAVAVAVAVAAAAAAAAAATARGVRGQRGGGIRGLPAAVAPIRSSAPWVR